MPLSSATNICPLCRSPRITSRDWGRKVAGVIGCAAGAAGGFYGCLRTPHLSLSTGLAFSPSASALNGVAGAVLSALTGTAIGCEVGTAVGEQIDHYLLNNFECLDCSHAFSSNTTNHGYAPH